MKKEIRKANMIFNKNGNGFLSTKITIPVPWAKELGFSEDDKSATISLNENKIIIEKENKMKIENIKTGIIEEMTEQDFIHKLLIFIEHNGADYGSDEMYEIHNKLLEKDYEWTIENYEIFIEKFDINTMAKMMGCKIL